MAQIENHLREQKKSVYRALRTRLKERKREERAQLLELTGTQPSSIQAHKRQLEIERQREINKVMYKYVADMRKQGESINDNLVGTVVSSKMVKDNDLMNVQNLQKFLKININVLQKT